MRKEALFLPNDLVLNIRRKYDNYGLKYDSPLPANYGMAGTDPKRGDFAPFTNLRKEISKNLPIWIQELRNNKIQDGEIKPVIDTLIIEHPAIKDILERFPL